MHVLVAGVAEVAEVVKAAIAAGADEAAGVVVAEPGLEEESESLEGSTMRRLWSLADETAGVWVRWRWAECSCS